MRGFGTGETNYISTIDHKKKLSCGHRRVGFFQWTTGGFETFSMRSYHKIQPIANPERSKCETKYIYPRDASPDLTDAQLLRMVQRALDILHPDQSIAARPVQAVSE